MQKPLDLKAIKERAEKATAGPWHYDGMHYEITAPSTEGHYWIIASECRSVPGEPPVSDQFGHEFAPDFDFLAHSREDIPALIAEVERLEHELAESKAYIEELLAEAGG